MKTWKRAVLYLIRKKYRSIILILLISVMSTLAVAGNFMKSGADKEIDTIHRNLGSSFVVAADIQNESMYEEQYDKEYSYSIFTGKRITPQLVKEITDVDGIVDYEIKSSMIVWSDLKTREAAWADAIPNEVIDEENLKLCRESTIAIFCGNGEANVNFRTGAFTITSGRNLLEGDNSAIVISEYLAERNGVHVGDFVEVETKRGNFEITDTPFETLGIPVKLEIVGIFSVNFKQEIDMFTHEENVAENFLFIDQHSGSTLNGNLKELYPEDDSYSEVTFFVDSPENLDTVLENVKNSTDLSGLKVSLDDSAYSASVKPLRQIRMFSVILIGAGTIGCAAILYLVLSLWIRTRRNEIGILLSVGISKGKIIGQMILECGAVAAVSLLLTIAALPPVTDTFFHMAEEATAPKENQESYTVEQKYGELLPEINKVASEKVELKYESSWKDYIILIVAVYVISSVSVLAASIQIMKIPPKLLLQSG